MAAVLVHHWVGPDAMNWIGPQRDVPQEAKLCIHPSPFGTQCTMHAPYSLRSCLLMKSCSSLTCPSPEPYERGRRRDKITGKICQARSTVDYEQWRKGPGRLAASHGMCAPSGCNNFFIAHVRVRGGLDFMREQLQELPPQTTIILLASNVPSSVTSGWLGLPPSLGALNTSDLSLSGEARRMARLSLAGVETLHVFLLRDSTPRQRRLHARALGQAGEMAKG